MIEPKKYVEIVKSYFQFLVDEYDFQEIEEKLGGNVFYDISYLRGNIIVSVSYENIEDYLLVIVFILVNGRLPDYDNETKTLHLDKLVSEVLPTLTKEDLFLNKEYFSKFDAVNDFDRRLLKAAMELRICLEHSERIRDIMRGIEN